MKIKNYNKFINESSNIESDDLRAYSTYQLDLTNWMNVLHNNNSKEKKLFGKVDYLSDIGKYIANNDKFKNDYWLAYFLNKDKINSDRYASICITFITSTLGKDNLYKMFGDPILHNEFGEGFDENEKDPEIFGGVGDYTYASYFPTINDTKIHIGYDHRGTSVELPRNMYPEDAVKILEKLADICADVI